MYSGKPSRPAIAAAGLPPADHKNNDAEYKALIDTLTHNVQAALSTENPSAPLPRPLAELIIDLAYDANDFEFLSAYKTGEIRQYESALPAKLHREILDDLYRLSSEQPCEEGYFYCMLGACIAIHKKYIYAFQYILNAANFPLNMNVHLFLFALKNLAFDCAVIFIKNKIIDVNRVVIHNDLTYLQKQIAQAAGDEKNATERVGFLLAHGAHPDVYTDCKLHIAITGLAYAAGRGYTNIVNLLLAAQASTTLHILHKIDIALERALLHPHTGEVLPQHIQCASLLLQHALAFPEKNPPNYPQAQIENVRKQIAQGDQRYTKHANDLLELFDCFDAAKNNLLFFTTHWKNTEAPQPNQTLINKTIRLLNAHCASVSRPALPTFFQKIFSSITLSPEEKAAEAILLAMLHGQHDENFLLLLFRFENSVEYQKTPKKCALRGFVILLKAHSRKALHWDLGPNMDLEHKAPAPAAHARAAAEAAAGAGADAAYARPATATNPARTKAIAEKIAAVMQHIHDVEADELAKKSNHQHLPHRPK